MGFHKLSTVLTTLMYSSAVLSLAVPPPTEIAEIVLETLQVVPGNTYRLCVPNSKLALCHQMIENRTTGIQCVPAPDKISCLDRIIKGEADWTVLEPEGLYVAHRFLPNDGVLVSSEIRSIEYSNRDFLYAPVAVVRKSSGIQSICDLKGKRSCHTGFGKTAGWRVPFSHLFIKGELTCPNATASYLERDIAAVAKYFGATCAPGKWGPDSKLDKELKAMYPELCELCKDPATCSKNDEYANYDGALKCLTENNGDVAWTKFDAVKEFFKLGDATPLAITDDYELLCSDGSKMPLTSEDPCSWAKRPWWTVVVTSRLASKPEVVKSLQDEITTLRKEAQNLTTIPEWLTKVLDFHKSSDVEFHYDPKKVKTITPDIYLKPTNYSETLWHPTCGVHEKSLKLCVTNQVEMQKCNTLKLAAMGQRIYPGFSCVLEDSPSHCSKVISMGGADLMVANSIPAYNLEKNPKLDTKLVSILREVEPTDIPSETVPFRYALAVISNETAVEFQGSLSPLKGKRSCHVSIKSLAGWNAPLSVLRDAGEITGENCDLPVELSKYFEKSCVPGYTNVPELCSLCAGDGDAPESSATPGTVCADNHNERYYGSYGALRCLTEKVADVAFIHHVALLEKLKSPERDSLKNLKLLCRNGTVLGLDEFRACNWGIIPTRKVLVRGGEEDAVRREDIRLNLLKTQELFRTGGKQEKSFKMFGEYYGTIDVIFKDTSVGLQDELSKEETDAENKLIEDFDYCFSAKSPSHYRPSCSSSTTGNHHT